MNKEQLRQQSQLEFSESGIDIVVGSIDGLGIDVEALKAISRDSSYVEQVFDSGLTAVVYKLRLAGKAWTLKLKRPTSLVKNIDGQTSFLNEVQRRRDLQRLKADNQDAFRHIVDTQYASFLDGIILSPWIEGQPIEKLDDNLFEQIFFTLCELEKAGLFEWDLCPGNLLLNDEGELKLFDFGYMYTFDPLTEFNSNGVATPLFHGVERFETRFLFTLLLSQQELSKNEQFELYAKMKKVAVTAYQHKRQVLAQKGASNQVLQWLDNVVREWQQGLSSECGLRKLYRKERFRSTLLDLLDDVHGKSCNSVTLSKADYVIDAIEREYDTLLEQGGLFFGDEKLSQEGLVAKYQKIRADAVRYQL
ncbi:hypothetical protein [Vibrio paucivorans]|uniref:Phosphotransferase n=1 Tax=Vibrio paucivorans TaxID=2829489 RepID=A0A9X3HR89_9VIBR|nr:hypothetical protein [Vibrio paucivorans]MCW8333793.1 hypothetical protein [Vibrio paucivorans]